MVLVCSSDFARPLDQRIMWLYRYEPIELSHHLAKPGGYRCSGSTYIMVFICHVTLQDHVIKALYDIMFRNPSKDATILPSLVAIEAVVLEICRVISQDQVTKGLWLHGQEPIKVNYHSARFGGDRDYGNGDIMIFVCHVTFEDHMFKLSNDFMIRSASMYFTKIPIFVCHRHCGSGDISFSLSGNLSRPRDQRVMWLYE